MPVWWRRSITEKKKDRRGRGIIFDYRRGLGYSITDWQAPEGLLGPKYGREQGAKRGKSRRKGKNGGIEIDKEQQRPSASE